MIPSEKTPLHRQKMNTRDYSKVSPQFARCRTVNVHTRLVRALPQQHDSTSHTAWIRNKYKNGHPLTLGTKKSSGWMDGCAGEPAERIRFTAEL